MQLLGSNTNEQYSITLNLQTQARLVCEVSVYDGYLWNVISAHYMWGFTLHNVMLAENVPQDALADL